MADKAREKALKKMAAKPQVDPEVEAKRREARLAREAAAAEKSAARREAIAKAKAALAARRNACPIGASAPAAAKPAPQLVIGKAPAPVPEAPKARPTRQAGLPGPTINAKASQPTSEPLRPPHKRRRQ